MLIAALIAIGVGIAVPVLLHVLQQRRSARQARLSRASFPFNVYAANQIDQLKERLCGPLAKLPHLPRRPPAKQAEFEQWMDSGNVLLTGRQGLGKTREALESIERVTLAKGKEVLVLVPHENCDVPFVIPTDLPHRNIVLFIDDVHLLFEDPGHSPDVSFAERSFETRFAAIVDRLESRFAGTSLRLVLTARDEPDLRARRQPGSPIWNRTRERQVPYIHKSVRSHFIRAVARFYDLELSEEGVQLIGSKSDGTCLGITTALAQFPQSSTVSVDEIRERRFGFPANWKIDVFEKLIQPDPVRRAVFSALTIVRRCHLRPRRELVRELAVRLLKKATLFKRKKVLRAIKDLRAWMFELQGEIVCPHALLDVLDVEDEAARRIRPILMRLLQNLQVAPLLRLDLAKVVPGLGSNLLANDDLIAVLERAARSGSAPAELWVTLSSAYRLAGVLDKATDAAILVTRLAPEQAEGWISLSILVSKQGDPDRGERLARIATRVDGTNAKGWLCLGVVLDKLGNSAGAVAALRRACELEPSWAKAHHSLAIAYSQEVNPNFALALKHAELATELSPTDATSWEILGILRDRSGNSSEAVRVLERAFAMDPRSATALVSLARAYEAIGTPEKSLPLLRDAQRRHRGQTEVERVIAIQLVYLDLPDATREGIALGRAIAERTDEAGDWVRLSIALIKSGHPMEAVSASLHVLKNNPEDREALFSLSMTLAQMSPKEAELARGRIVSDLGLDTESALKAIKVDPTSYGAWRLLAWSCSTEVDRQSAASVAIEYLEQNPQLHTAILALPEEFRSRAPSAADKVISALIAGNPNEKIYHNLKGAILRNTDPLEAVDCHKRALTIDGRFAPAWYALGRAYEAAGTDYLDDARSAYQQGAILGHRKSAERLASLDSRSETS